MLSTILVPGRVGTSYLHLLQISQLPGRLLLVPPLHGGSAREGTPHSGPRGARPASLSPVWSPQPVPNHNPWMLLYFISFLLIVSFFVLNMFVGVVVENFHKCRQHQEAEEARRREEKRLRRLEKKRRSEWVTCGEGDGPRPGLRCPLLCGGLGLTAATGPLDPEGTEVSVLLASPFPHVCLT